MTIKNALVSDSHRADDLMRRLLWVKPQADNDEVGQSAERTLGLSLLFSGVRCILQYAVLPFVLPLVGIAADAATPFLLLLTFLAMISIFFSLRRFWQINYTHRWQYLGVAVGALLLLVAFTLYDLNIITL